MPVFIELTTDAFSTTFNKKLEDAGRQRRAGANRARRPLRGLEIKDDTYAYFKVVQSDGTELSFLDSGSPDGKSKQYTNFILQSAMEARMEKHQIVETFGEPYIFFFGEQPRFVDYSAVLINSNDFNWEAEWWANYERYLRGTKSVEMGARTYLFYDDTVVEGYMLQAQCQKISDAPLSVQLTWRMFVTNYTNVSFVGDPNFPVRASVNLPPDVSASTADPFTLATEAVGASIEAYDADSRALAAALAQQASSGFGGANTMAQAFRNGANPDEVASNGDGTAPSAGGDPLSGIAKTAFETLFGAVKSGRQLPYRGLIADNVDEWTALPPAPPKPDEQQSEEDRDGNAETEDVIPKVNNIFAPCGINLGTPTAMNGLGLGPNFGTGAGVGFGAGAGAGAGAFASFGVGGAASTGNPYGGINNGMGFVGSQGVGAGYAASAGFTAGPGGFNTFSNSGSYAGAVNGAGYNQNGQYVGNSYGMYGSPTYPNNPALNQPIGANNLPLGANGALQGFGTNGQGFVTSYGPIPTTPGYNPNSRTTYANGVQVGGGLVAGTGVAGGVSGGVGGFYGAGGNITPFGDPVGQYTGGPVYQGVQAPAGGGYGYANPSNGASVKVGGAASAFAMISVSASVSIGGSIGFGAGAGSPPCQPALNPNASTASAVFGIGPNGTFSNTNTTGLFAP